jgi:hypothetical protein
MIGSIHYYMMIMHIFVFLNLVKLIEHITILGHNSLGSISEESTFSFHPSK